MIHKTLEKHSDIMAREYNIADIGSGISPVTPDISKTVFIELEKQAVDFLRKQGLNAVKGDITHLSFQKESFDAILCSEVLEHVPNYKKGISEMARVLKKNGLVIITVPIHQKYWKDDDEFVGHCRRFDPETLAKDIKASGLQIVERKPIGSRLERWLTWNIVKIARRKGNKEMNANKVKLFAFYAINTLLLQFIKIAAALTSEENSSIILFAAKKN